MDNNIKNGEPVILLVRGEDGGLRAVTGMEPNGKLNTVSPTKENADKFLNIDSRGNVLENFMQKFSAQYQTPSHTGLYAIAASAVDKMSGFLDKIIKVNPNDKVLEPYRVKPKGEDEQPSLSNSRYKPLDLNKVDWKEADRLGLTPEKLRDALKSMAYKHKSGLVDIKMEVDGKEYPVKARLSLDEQPDGTIKIQTHPRQEKPDFDKPFMGETFTAKDIAEFERTGNGGRVFYLENEPGGEKVPSLVSLDPLTNRFEAVAQSDINIPLNIKNKELDEVTRETLYNGGEALVEGMDKRLKEGEEPTKIDRILQYNAVNRNFDFRFTPEQREQHRLERQAKAAQDAPLKARKVGDVWVRPVQGGVELSREQFEKVCNKEAVFVEGMQRRQPKPKEGAQQVEATDKKGKKYNAWVWVDPDKGHVRHTSKHPDELKAAQGNKVTPAEGFKTQAAVNNEGKTNEATKHSQAQGEPLKKGQTQPTEKQAEKKKEQQQRQSPSAPKKSTGRKVGH